MPVLFRDAPLYVDLLIAKAGAGVTELKGTGADATTYVESGAGVSARVASGVRFTEAHSGIGISERVGSGAKAIVVAETGTGVAIFSETGVKADQFTKTGNGVSERSASGVRAGNVSKFNAGEVDFSGSGAKTHSSTKTGAGVTPFTVGGAAPAVVKSKYLVVDTVFPVYPVVTFTGIAKDPELTNVDTGARLRFYGLTLAGTDTLVLDHQNQTAKVNGVRVYGWSGTFFPIKSYNSLLVGARNIGAGFSATITTPGAGPHIARTMHGAAVSERKASGPKVKLP